MVTRRSLGVLIVAFGILLAGCLSGGFGGTNAIDDPSSTTAPTTADTTEPTATATATRTVPVKPYDTREALSEQAPFAVPDPNVPATFTFDSGIVRDDGNVSQVQVAYHYRVDENASDDEEGQLHNVLSVGKFEGDTLNRSQGESVTVGDREARYVQDGDGRRALLWECGQHTYRVSVQSYGEEFGEDDLFAVAESIDCNPSEDEGT